MTSNKLTGFTLRSFLFSALQGAGDRQDIIQFCENFKAEEFIEAHRIEADTQEVTEVFAAVRSDLDKGEFDVDEYDTDDTDFGDFTDLFAGMDSLYEKLYEMKCIAELGENEDRYHFTTPGDGVDLENWQSAEEPRWFKFLREYEGVGLQYVTLRETNRYGAVDSQSYVLCLPGEIKTLKADCAEWAEQFIRKYKLTCVYLGREVSREFTHREMTSGHDNPVVEVDGDFTIYDEDWGKSCIFKMSGTDMEDCAGNAVNTDPLTWRYDAATEIGIFKAFDHNVLTFETCNEMLEEAGETLLFMVDENGVKTENVDEVDWFLTFDSNGLNEKTLKMLDEAEWEIENL